MPDIALTVTVRCADCGDELESPRQDAEETSRDGYRVMVEPCGRCVKKAEDLARDAGYELGQADAENAAADAARERKAKP